MEATANGSNEKQMEATANGSNEKQMEATANGSNGKWKQREMEALHSLDKNIGSCGSNPKAPSGSLRHAWEENDAQKNHAVVLKKEMGKQTIIYIYIYERIRYSLFEETQLEPFLQEGTPPTCCPMSINNMCISIYIYICVQCVYRKSSCVYTYIYIYIYDMYIYDIHISLYV